MNKDLERVIEVPEGVVASVSEKEFIVKKGGKELKRSFDVGKIKTSVTPAASDGKQMTGKITLVAKGASRREAKMMGTIAAHLKNMIDGLTEDFIYELEICNVHFPMNVSVQKVEQKDAGGRMQVAREIVVIKSFLGETTERVAKVLDGVKIDINGSKVTVSSADIEKAGQVAANLEKATRLTGRDRRIFQDGIFITKKPGRVI